MKWPFKVELHATSLLKYTAVPLYRKQLQYLAAVARNNKKFPRRQAEHVIYNKTLEEFLSPPLVAVDLVKVSQPETRRS